APQQGAEGWDTVHGFFYAENEKAAATAQGAADQVHGGRAYEEASLGKDWKGIVTGPVKTQAGGEEYVVGVGNSRYYTGVGGSSGNKEPSADVLANEAGVGGAYVVTQGGDGAIAEAVAQQQAALAVQQQQAAAAAVQAAVVRALPSTKGGIVSASTIQYLAEMGQRKMQIAAAAKAAHASSARPAKKAAVALVGDYASDEE
ncbi:hypothetical protein HK101_004318, partial [Irineochytrium annulatum]